MAPTPERSLAKSREYFARARHVIPSCTQTFSKGHTQFVQGVAPIFLERGRGSHVWDVDGNEYVDYVMALCPIVLGYDDPDVVAAVQRQLADGVTFSLAHPLEVEVAGSPPSSSSRSAWSSPRETFSSAWRRSPTRTAPC